MTSRSIRCISWLLGPWLLGSLALAQEHPHAEPAIQGYSRSEARYAIPDVTLVDAAGSERSLRAVLDAEGPVVLQFIFTTCPGVCPVLSGTLAAVRLPPGTAVRRVSITIDPEHDTPERLRAYAERFDVADDAGWVFLTGSAADVVAVQKAFAVYRGDKMQHEPVTLLRAGPQASWVRLEGFPSAKELGAEIDALLP